MIILYIAHKSGEDFLSGEFSSMTICDDETIVTFEGPGIKWQIPLKEIAVITVRKEND